MTMNDMKVVFLDIDGVIQPLGKQDRFKHLDEIEEIARHWIRRFPDSTIMNMSPRKVTQKVSSVYTAGNAIFAQSFLIGLRKL